jgi:hypothetical protein
METLKEYVASQFKIAKENADIRTIATLCKHNAYGAVQFYQYLMLDTNNFDNYNKAEELWEDNYRLRFEALEMGL